MSLGKHFYWKNCLLTNHWKRNFAIHSCRNESHSKTPMNQIAYIIRARILTTQAPIYNETQTMIFEHQRRWSRKTIRRQNEHKIRERMPMKLSKNSKLRTDTTIETPKDDDKWGKWGQVIEKYGKLGLKLDAFVITAVVGIGVALSVYQYTAYGKISWMQAIRQWAYDKYG